mmetsp:Transcript_34726/g.73968  ORF Transcript_34726/g.73968 Transcript_34726/m.73968 type:complete len:272 (+) Transcript_34726:225-1040(+)
MRDWTETEIQTSIQRSFICTAYTFQNTPYENPFFYYIWNKVRTVYKSIRRDTPSYLQHGFPKDLHCRGKNKKLTSFHPLRAHETLLLPLLRLPPLLGLLPLPLLPLTQFYLDRSTAQPALIHLPYRLGAVLGIQKAHEAVSSRLAVRLVVHDARHSEARIPSKVLLQVVLLEVLGEVPHEEPKVVLGPLGEGGVRPCLPRGRSDVGLGVGVDRGRGRRGVLHRGLGGAVAVGAGVARVRGRGRNVAVTGRRRCRRRKVGDGGRAGRERRGD